MNVRHTHLIATIRCIWKYLEDVRIFECELHFISINFLCRNGRETTKQRYHFYKVFFFSSHFIERELDFVCEC